MSFEVALRQRLMDSPAATLVGRVKGGGPLIDWQLRPEKGDYPAVVLQLVGDDRAQTMTGFNRWRRTRIQIDCMALRAPVKVALREAVISTITPRARVHGVRFGRALSIVVRDLSENTDTQFVHRDSIDLALWHMED